VIIGGGDIGAGGGFETTTPTTPPTAILPTLASCTEADTHIAFTAEELAQLDTLSRQFYALAPTLHSDADVSSAQSAYDSFALQLSQVQELTAYARAQTPKLTDPQLKRRVATPFWNERDMVATLFPGDPDIETKHCGGEHCSVTVYYADSEDENMNKEEVQLARALLERYLRPSLW
jgi:hypothetical protein